MGWAPPASAEVPGKVQIQVTCGGRTVEATSGLGGFAAWTAEQDGQRLVLLPVSVSGTVTDAQGTVLRSFAQELGRHDPGPTTACAFEFAMEDKRGDVLTIAGHGQFVSKSATAQSR
jgi:hypothetical protein